MRRVVVGVVASLLCSMLFASPTDAVVKKRVTLWAPAQVGDSSVRLAGRVTTPHRPVLLQRWANGRWVTVERLRVADDRYAAEVRAPRRPQRFRTVAGRLSSPVRVVRPIRTVPVVEPTRPTPVDACGPRPLKLDGTRWSCTFADDFDGADLDRSRWVPQTVFATGDRQGTYACYRDHPDNVAVAGGALHLTVRKEDHPVACGVRGLEPTRFSAGMVSTYHLFSQRYGRFEARIKNTATTSPGLQEAFWLWPDDRQALSVLWPAAGEIDIVETYSQHPHHAIPFLHYTEDDNGGPVPGLNTAWHCRAERGGYSTFTLEWTQRRLEVLVDGRSCLVNTSGDAAFQRSYIVALTQALGEGTNSFDGTAPLPATMSVDYVRVWK